MLQSSQAQMTAAPFRLVSINPRIPAPAKNLLGPQAVTTSDFRHDRTRRQCLLHDLRLLIRRPATTTTGAVDHLKSARNPLRVKRKVKSRHKTIPIQRPSASRLRSRNERWEQDDAYEGDRADAGERRTPDRHSRRSCWNPCHIPGTQKTALGAGKSQIKMVAGAGFNNYLRSLNAYHDVLKILLTADQGGLFRTAA